MKKNFLSRVKDAFEKTAAAGLITALIMCASLILVGIDDNAGEYSSVYAAVGISVICGVLFVQICVTVSLMLPGIKAPFVSDYDRIVIGRAFSCGSKKRRFFYAFEMFREEEFSDALDIFRELKDEKLTEREEGVLAFYTSVCYSRMGYSTNAAGCAALAAEKNVQLPESLLMAARDYSISASFARAGEYYERLLPIAEERRLFPFIYNEMGRMYLSANEPKKSRACFEKAVENGFDPITAQGGLAIVSLLEGKEDEACERYRLAIIAKIGDVDGYKDYCAQICTANGYPENFFEEHLRERFGRDKNKS